MSPVFFKLKILMLGINGKVCVSAFPISLNLLNLINIIKFTSANAQIITVAELAGRLRHPGYVPRVSLVFLYNT
jgi:hypothetical protein